MARGAQSWSARLAKSLKGTAMGLVERVDFVKLLHRLTQSERSRPWLARYADLAPAWANQEEVARLAVDLALAQISAEGRKADRDDLARIVSAISVQYDLEIHRAGIVGLSATLGAAFSHQDPARPFTSPDGRELAHAETLRGYQEQGLGVIYLINHNTHLDEFLVDCVLGHAGLRLPVFAAGQNMMVIKSLAKVLMVGSYVVQRRGATRDGLAALFNYCRALAESGGPQGIFLEAWHGGARSRDGGLRYPRRLVTLSGALASAKDVVVQPVAISYAVIPEDLSLAADAGPRCWVRGMGLWRTLGLAAAHPRTFLWRALDNLYGRAYVTLPRPWLLSEIKALREKERADLNLDEFVALTAIQEIARTKKIMASQLTARGLLRAGRLPRLDLYEATAEEMERLSEYHRQTFNQEPDLEDFIRDRALAEVVDDGLATLKRRGVVSRRPHRRGHPPQVLSNRGLAFYATHGDRRIYSPTADQNIVVAGASDWGFALTCLVGSRILEEKRYLNASLILYDPRVELATEANATRSLPGRFKDHRLPRNAFVTADSTQAFRKASEVLLAASPTGLADVIREVLKRSEQPFKLIVAACAFEAEDHRLPCQMVLDLAREAGRSDVAVYALAGLARETDLVEGKAAVGVLAGPPAGLEKLADLFNWPPIGVELSHDPLGVQAAVILARVYALWGNFLAGAGQITGAAALGRFMAQAAAEARQLGLALGATDESFAASSLAWTMTLTAEGMAGGSHRYGRKLGGLAKRKEHLAEAARRLYHQYEAAGEKLPAYHDLKSAHHLALQRGLTLPLLAEAYGTLWGR